MTAERNRLIGRVHAAASRWGLDEDARRALQLRVAGKSSCADMTVGELERVLAELRRHSPRGAGAGHQRKVKALWISLYYLGVVDDRRDSAIDAFVRRQAKVDALRFLTPSAASAVIEALRGMAARDGGVDWDGWTGNPPIKGDQVHVVHAIWGRLERLGVLKAPAVFGLPGYGKRMGLPDDPRRYEAAHWDTLIRTLGRRLRDAERSAHGPARP